MEQYEAAGSRLSTHRARIIIGQYFEANFGYTVSPKLVQKGADGYIDTPRPVFHVALCGTGTTTT